MRLKKPYTNIASTYIIEGEIHVSGCAFGHPHSIDPHIHRTIVYGVLWHVGCLSLELPLTMTYNSLTQLFISLFSFGTFVTRLVADRRQHNKSFFFNSCTHSTFFCSPCCTFSTFNGLYCARLFFLHVFSMKTMTNNDSNSLENVIDNFPVFFLFCWFHDFIRIQVRMHF